MKSNPQRIIKTAIITAAGFGSRFLPITKTFPKELLPVWNKPVLQYLVEECATAGIERIIIVVRGEQLKIFKDYFHDSAAHVYELLREQGKLDRWQSVKQLSELPLIEFIAQDAKLPYGNGSPIASAKHLIGKDESFAVLFGDDMFITTHPKGGIGQLIATFQGGDYDGALAAVEIDPIEVHKYGAITLKSDNSTLVESIVEKPALGTQPSNLVTYGRFILPSEIFEYLVPSNAGKDGELWLQDANNRLAKTHKLMWSELNGKWMTTGDPAQMYQVWQHLAQQSH